jgi:hypothetical protein
MNPPLPLSIDAVVDEHERPAVVAASEQLGECLAAASGNPWPVEVRFHASVTSIDLGARPSVVVLSMLRELARPPESSAAMGMRWREELRALAPPAVPAVLICTIFRHAALPAEERRSGTPSPLIERIRRLNLFAIELSNDTGAGVIDIDRVFAHLGARALKTDFRLAGPLAAETAAYTMVSALLEFGLDDVIPPDVQQRAQKRHGALADIGKLLARRLARAR